jgi:hypothetical protein
MASAITHAVSGAAISTLAPRPYRGGTLAAVLALAAVAPDLDVIGLRLGIPYAHPLGHRGFSHSLLGALFMALPIAVAFSRRARRWGGPRSACWQWSSPARRTACSTHDRRRARRRLLHPLQRRPLFLPWPRCAPRR